MSALKTASETETKLDVEQKTAETPQMEPAEPDEPDFFGGDGPTSCQWEDGWCDELADHYILSYCNYPNCKDDHTSRYCLRHYIISLGLKLDHLKTCPGMLEATTPDEVRQCAIEHVPGFGEIALNDDRPAMNPVDGPDGRADISDGSDADTAKNASDLDAEIERLQESAHVYAGAYDDLRMSKETTIEDIQKWLDGLELSHEQLSVKYFSWANDEKMYLQELRYDQSWGDKPYSFRAYDPGAGEAEWSAYDTRSIEQRDLISPKLVTEIDPDTDGREFRYIYTSDTLQLKEMLDHWQLTDDRDESVPFVFAICEARSNTVIPITNESWIQWRAMYDGDQNQLTVCNWPNYRRRIAPYLDYFDEDKPLDVDRAKAKAADIERRLNRIIKDGVNPARA